MAKIFVGMKNSARVSVGAVLCAFGLLWCLMLLLPPGASAALSDSQSAQLAALNAAMGPPQNLSLAAAVESLIRGGANAADLVYAAIVSGKDAAQVITGALNAGADLQVVFNAAYRAGATRSQMLAGAGGHNFTAEQIANAYTEASTGGGAGGTGGAAGMGGIGGGSELGGSMGGTNASPSVPK